MVNLSSFKRDFLFLSNTLISIFITLKKILYLLFINWWNVFLFFSLCLLLFVIILTSLEPDTQSKYFLILLNPILKFAPVKELKIKKIYFYRSKDKFVEFQTIIDIIKNKNNKSDVAENFEFNQNNELTKVDYNQTNETEKKIEESNNINQVKLSKEESNDFKINDKNISLQDNRNNNISDNKVLNDQKKIFDVKTFSASVPSFSVSSPSKAHFSPTKDNVESIVSPVSFYDPFNINENEEFFTNTKFPANKRFSNFSAEEFLSNKNQTPGTNATDETEEKVKHLSPISLKENINLFDDDILNVKNNYRDNDSESTASNVSRRSTSSSSTATTASKALTNNKSYHNSMSIDGYETDSTIENINPDVSSLEIDNSNINADIVKNQHNLNSNRFENFSISFDFDSPKDFLTPTLENENLFLNKSISSSFDQFNDFHNKIPFQPSKITSSNFIPSAPSETKKQFFPSLSYNSLKSLESCSINNSDSNEILKIRSTIIENKDRNAVEEQMVNEPLDTNNIQTKKYDEKQPSLLAKAIDFYRKLIPITRFSLIIEDVSFIMPPKSKYANFEFSFSMLKISLSLIHLIMFLFYILNFVKKSLKNSTYLRHVYKFAEVDYLPEEEDDELLDHISPFNTFSYPVDSSISSNTPNSQTSASPSLASFPVFSIINFHFHNFSACAKDTTFATFIKPPQTKTPPPDIDKSDKEKEFYIAPKVVMSIVRKFIRIFSFLVSFSFYNFQFNFNFASKNCSVSGKSKILRVLPQPSKRLKKFGTTIVLQLHDCGLCIRNEDLISLVYRGERSRVCVDYFLAKGGMDIFFSMLKKKLTKNILDTPNSENKTEHNVFVSLQSLLNFHRKYQKAEEEQALIRFTKLNISSGGGCFAGESEDDYDLYIHDLRHPDCKFDNLHNIFGKLMDIKTDEKEDWWWNFFNKNCNYSLFSMLKSKKLKLLKMKIDKFRYELISFQLTCYSFLRVQRGLLCHNNRDFFKENSKVFNEGFQFLPSLYHKINKKKMVNYDIVLDPNMKNGDSSIPDIKTNPEQDDDVFWHPRDLKVNPFTHSYELYLSPNVEKVQQFSFGSIKFFPYDPKLYCDDFKSNDLNDDEFEDVEYTNEEKNYQVNEVRFIKSNKVQNFGDYVDNETSNVDVQSLDFSHMNSSILDWLLILQHASTSMKSSEFSHKKKTKMIINIPFFSFSLVPTDFNIDSTGGIPPLIKNIFNIYELNNMPLQYNTSTGFYFTNFNLVIDKNTSEGNLNSYYTLNVREFQINTKTPYSTIENKYNVKVVENDLEDNFEENKDSSIKRKATTFIGSEWKFKDFYMKFFMGDSPLQFQEVFSSSLTIDLINIKLKKHQRINKRMKEKIRKYKLQRPSLKYSDLFSHNKSLFFNYKNNSVHYYRYLSAKNFSTSFIYGIQAANYNEIGSEDVKTIFQFHMDEISELNFSFSSHFKLLLSFNIIKSAINRCTLRQEGIKLLPEYYSILSCIDYSDYQKFYSQYYNEIVKNSYESFLNKIKTMPPLLPLILPSTFLPPSLTTYKTLPTKGSNLISDQMLDEMGEKLKEFDPYSLLSEDNDSNSFSYNHVHPLDLIPYFFRVKQSEGTLLCVKVDNTNLVLSLQCAYEEIIVEDNNEAEKIKKEEENRKENEDNIRRSLNKHNPIFSPSTLENIEEESEFESESESESGEDLEICSDYSETDSESESEYYNNQNVQSKKYVLNSKVNDNLGLILNLKGINYVGNSSVQKIKVNIDECYMFSCINLSCPIISYKNLLFHKFNIKYDRHLERTKNNELPHQILFKQRGEEDGKYFVKQELDGYDKDNQRINYMIVNFEQMDINLSPVLGSEKIIQKLLFQIQAFETANTSSNQDIFLMNNINKSIYSRKDFECLYLLEQHYLLKNQYSLKDHIVNEIDNYFGKKIQNVINQNELISNFSGYNPQLIQFLEYNLFHNQQRIKMIERLIIINKYNLHNKYKFADLISKNSNILNQLPSFFYNPSLFSFQKNSFESINGTTFYEYIERNKNYLNDFIRLEKEKEKEKNKFENRVISIDYNEEEDDDDEDDNFDFFNYYSYPPPSFYLDSIIITQKTPYLLQHLISQKTLPNYFDTNSSNNLIEKIISKYSNPSKFLIFSNYLVKSNHHFKYLYNAYLDQNYYLENIPSLHLFSQSESNDESDHGISLHTQTCDNFDFTKSHSLQIDCRSSFQPFSTSLSTLPDDYDDADLYNAGFFGDIGGDSFMDVDESYEVLKNPGDELIPLDEFIKKDEDKDSNLPLRLFNYQFIDFSKLSIHVSSPVQGIYYKDTVNLHFKEFTFLAINTLIDRKLQEDLFILDNLGYEDPENYQFIGTILDDSYYNKPKSHKSNIKKDFLDDPFSIKRKSSLNSIDPKDKEYFFVKYNQPFGGNSLFLIKTLSIHLKEQILPVALIQNIQWTGPFYLTSIIDDRLIKEAQLLRIFDSLLPTTVNHLNSEINPNTILPLDENSQSILKNMKLENYITSTRSMHFLSPHHLCDMFSYSVRTPNPKKIYTQSKITVGSVKTFGFLDSLILLETFSMALSQSLPSTPPQGPSLPIWDQLRFLFHGQLFIDIKQIEISAISGTLAYSEQDSSTFLEDGKIFGKPINYFLTDERTRIGLDISSFRISINTNVIQLATETIRAHGTFYNPPTSIFEPRHTASKDSNNAKSLNTKSQYRNSKPKLSINSPNTLNSPLSSIKTSLNLFTDNIFNIGTNYSNQSNYLEDCNWLFPSTYSHVTTFLYIPAVVVSFTSRISPFLRPLTNIINDSDKMVSTIQNTLDGDGKSKSKSSTINLEDLLNQTHIYNHHDVFLHPAILSCEIEEDEGLNEDNNLENREDSTFNNLQQATTMEAITYILPNISFYRRFLPNGKSNSLQPNLRVNSIKYINNDRFHFFRTRTMTYSYSLQVRVTDNKLSPIHFNFPLDKINKISNLFKNTKIVNIDPFEEYINKINEENKVIRNNIYNNLNPNKENKQVKKKEEDSQSSSLQIFRLRKRRTDYHIIDETKSGLHIANPLNLQSSPLQSINSSPASPPSRTSIKQKNNSPQTSQIKIPDPSHRYHRNNRVILKPRTENHVSPHTFLNILSDFTIKIVINKIIASTWISSSDLRGVVLTLNEVNLETKIERDSLQNSYYDYYYKLFDLYNSQKFVYSTHNNDDSYSNFTYFTFPHFFYTLSLIEEDHPLDISNILIKINSLTIFAKEWNIKSLPKEIQDQFLLNFNELSSLQNNNSTPISPYLPNNITSLSSEPFSTSCLLLLATPASRFFFTEEVTIESEINSKKDSNNNENSFSSTPDISSSCFSIDTHRVLLRHYEKDKRLFVTSGRSKKSNEFTIGIEFEEEYLQCLKFREEYQEKFTEKINESSKSQSNQYEENLFESKSINHYRKSLLKIRQSLSNNENNNENLLSISSSTSAISPTNSNFNKYKRRSSIGATFIDFTSNDIPQINRFSIATVKENGDDKLFLNRRQSSDRSSIGRDSNESKLSNGDNHDNLLVEKLKSTRRRMSTIFSGGRNSIELNQKNNIIEIKNSSTEYLSKKIKKNDSFVNRRNHTLKSKKKEALTWILLVKEARMLYTLDIRDSLLTYAYNASITANNLKSRSKLSFQLDEEKEKEKDINFDFNNTPKFEINNRENKMTNENTSININTVSQDTEDNLEISTDKSKLFSLLPDAKIDKYPPTQNLIPNSDDLLDENQFEESNLGRHFLNNPTILTSSTIYDGLNSLSQSPYGQFSDTSKNTDDDRLKDKIKNNPSFFSSKKKKVLKSSLLHQGQKLIIVKIINPQINFIDPRTESSLLILANNASLEGFKSISPYSVESNASYAHENLILYPNSTEIRNNIYFFCKKHLEDQRIKQIELQEKYQKDLENYRQLLLKYEQISNSSNYSSSSPKSKSNLILPKAPQQPSINLLTTAQILDLLFKKQFDHDKKALHTLPNDDIVNAYASSFEFKNENEELVSFIEKQTSMCFSYQKLEANFSMSAVAAYTISTHIPFIEFYEKKGRFPMSSLPIEKVDPDYYYFSNWKGEKLSNSNKVSSTGFYYPGFSSSNEEIDHSYCVTIPKNLHSFIDDAVIHWKLKPLTSTPLTLKPIFNSIKDFSLNTSFIYWQQLNLAQTLERTISSLEIKKKIVNRQQYNRIFARRKNSATSTSTTSTEFTIENDTTYKKLKPNQEVSRSKPYEYIPFYSKGQDIISLSKPPQIVFKLHLPELFIEIQSWQFYIILNLIRNVLIVPPPNLNPEKDKVQTKEKNYIELSKTNPKLGPLNINYRESCEEIKHVVAKHMSSSSSNPKSPQPATSPIPSYTPTPNNTILSKSLEVQLDKITWTLLTGDNRAKKIKKQSYLPFIYSKSSKKEDTSEQDISSGAIILTLISAHTSFLFNEEGGMKAMFELQKFKVNYYRFKSQFEYYNLGSFNINTAEKSKKKSTSLNPLNIFQNPKNQEFEDKTLPFEDKTTIFGPVSRRSKNKSNVKEKKKAKNKKNIQDESLNDEINEDEILSFQPPLVCQRCNLIILPEDQESSTGCHYHGYHTPNGVEPGTFTFVEESDSENEENNPNIDNNVKEKKRRRSSLRNSSGSSKRRTKVEMWTCCGSKNPQETGCLSSPHLFHKQILARVEFCRPIKIDGILLSVINNVDVTFFPGLISSDNYIKNSDEKDEEHLIKIQLTKKLSSILTRYFDLSGDGIELDKMIEQTLGFKEDSIDDSINNLNIPESKLSEQLLLEQDRNLFPSTPLRQNSSDSLSSTNSFNNAFDINNSNHSDVSFSDRIDLNAINFVLPQVENYFNCTQFIDEANNKSSASKEQNPKKKEIKKDESITTVERNIVNSAISTSSTNSLPVSQEGVFIECFEIGVIPFNLSLAGYKISFRNFDCKIDRFKLDRSVMSWKNFINELLRHYAVSIIKQFINNSSLLKLTSSIKDAIVQTFKPTDTNYISLYSSARDINSKSTPQNNGALFLNKEKSSTSLTLKPIKNIFKKISKTSKKLTKVSSPKKSSKKTVKDEYNLMNNDTHDIDNMTSNHGDSQSEFHSDIPYELQDDSQYDSSSDHSASDSDSTIEKTTPTKRTQQIRDEIIKPSIRDYYGNNITTIQESSGHASSTNESSGHGSSINETSGHDSIPNFPKSSYLTKLFDKI